MISDINSPLGRTTDAPEEKRCFWATLKVASSTSQSTYLPACLPPSTQPSVRQVVIYSPSLTNLFNWRSSLPRTREIKTNHSLVYIPHSKRTTQYLRGLNQCGDLTSQLWIPMVQVSKGPVQQRRRSHLCPNCRNEDAQLKWKFIARNLKMLNEWKWESKDKTKKKGIC